MPKYQIPDSQKRFIQSNRSDVFGNLFSTFNMDFDVVEGKVRVRLTKYVDKENFFKVTVSELEEKDTPRVESEALVRSVKKTFESYLKLNKRVPAELLMSVLSISVYTAPAPEVVAKV
ncbi:MAG: hypothetical protein IIB77_09645 [Proteobacteria bacterium]|nr:hypothetical protein [Pseudomonadota bacterium]